MTDSKIFHEHQKDGKEYRAQGKAFFLTYPTCPLGKDRVYELLTKKFNPVNLIVCDEKHKNGTNHNHAYIQFGTKKNFKSPHWADLDGTVHGNYSTCKDRQGVMCYVMKENNYKMTTDFKHTTWHNYKKEKNDFIAWTQDNAYKQLTEPMPFELPDGTFIEKPEAKEKKVNWLIVAEPNSGKTLWANCTFEGKRVYCRTAGSNYPFDDYNDEELILYDDVYPTIQEILQVSNCYKLRQPVYGSTRYAKRYWAINQRRIMIILCNKERLPSYIDDEAFQSRFNRLDLDTCWEN